MKKILLTTALATLLATSVHASDMSLSDADGAVLYRKAVFSLIATNFGDVAAMAKGKKPYDANIAEMRLKHVMALAPLPWEAFDIAGSDKGKGTEAKAAVWSKADEFAKAREAFMKAVGDLNGLDYGDQGAVMAAFGAVGKTCKGCHDGFKE